MIPIEQQIEQVMRAEIAKAAEEEADRAAERLRARVSEIAASIPLRVVRQNNMAESRAVYSVEVDHLEMVRRREKSC